MVNKKPNLIVIVIIIIAFLFILSKGNFIELSVYTSSNLQWLRDKCDDLGSGEIYSKGSAAYCLATAGETTCVDEGYIFLEDCGGGGGGCTFSCSDSDGGIDIYEAGDTYVMYTTCGDITYEDFCSGNEVFEYSCGADNAEGEYILCPNGYTCSSGKCVSENGGTCTDTDGGINPDVYGEATDSYGTYKDFCASEEAIMERYCDGDYVTQIKKQCGVGKICDEDQDKCVTVGGCSNPTANVNQYYCTNGVIKKCTSNGWINHDYCDSEFETGECKTTSVSDSQALCELGEDIKDCSNTEADGDIGDYYCKNGAIIKCTQYGWETESVCDSGECKDDTFSVSDNVEDICEPSTNGNGEEIYCIITEITEGELWKETILGNKINNELPFEMTKNQQLKCTNLGFGDTCKFKVEVSGVEYSKSINQNQYYYCKAEKPFTFELNPCVWGADIAETVNIDTQYGCYVGWGIIIFIGALLLIPK